MLLQVFEPQNHPWTQISITYYDIQVSDHHRSISHIGHIKPWVNDHKRVTNSSLKSQWLSDQKILKLSPQILLKRKL